MNPKLCAAYVAGLAMIVAVPSLAAPAIKCAVQKADAAIPAASDAPSVRAAQMMAEIDAMGGVGGAAPNAEAQAALDAITNLMAGRADADSQVAAAMMRKYASPGAARPTAKSGGRQVPSC